MKYSLKTLVAHSAKNALMLFMVAGFSTAVWADKINLNTADAGTMQYIPGIGQSRAEQIVQAREKAGGFSSMEEIDAIPGIGDSTMRDVLKYGSLDSGVSILTEEMKETPPGRTDAMRQPAAGNSFGS